jgi:hypothetical protein
MSLFLALALFSSATVPPPRMLWTWYSTELKTPVPDGVGVAFVVASLRLEGTRDVVPFLRREPVAIPKGVYRMGVIRIEHSSPAFTPKQQDQAAQMIAEGVGMTRVPAVQIDFDAPKTAWPFYRDLLKDVRRRIGPQVFLSMTALVSWCGVRSWLAGADADEFVAMLFDMGPQRPREGLSREANGLEFPFAGCRKSIGVSINDLMKAPARRIYILPSFNDWTDQNVKRVLRATQ